jgi:hypothetical protein
MAVQYRHNADDEAAAVCVSSLHPHCSVRHPESPPPYFRLRVLEGVSKLVISRFKCTQQTRYAASQPREVAIQRHGPGCVIKALFNNPARRIVKADANARIFADFMT